MNYFDLQIRGRCAWIWLGNTETKNNPILPELLNELEEVWAKVEENEKIEGVVLSSRQAGFMPFVDLVFFIEIRELGVWESYGLQLQHILQKMENFSKPLVAAINGDCMGLGIELALVCDYRLAVANNRCFLSLPEVQLGLLPIGGSIQRLPRLIGIRAALDMMITGKKVNVYQAKKKGLIDQLVHPYQLELAAQQYTLNLIEGKEQRKSNLSLWNQWMENTSLGKAMMMDEARQKVHLNAYGNYPAPLKIIECVEVGYKLGIENGYHLGIKTMDEMVTHPISKQLIHTLFAVKSKKRNPLAKEVRPVSRIGIIGAGKMGEVIAKESLLKGFEVVLNDLSEKTLSQSQARIGEFLEVKAKKHLITSKRQVELMGRLQTAKSYQNFGKVDLVLEAVFENLELKRQVLSEAMEFLPEHCIYAVNTSAISISEIAEDSINPSQVIGMRYFSPILKSSLLEIVVTQQTAKWVVATAIEVGIRQGKTPIVVKDTPGFYTTRILAVVLNEALLLLEEGGDILQVDEVAKKLGFVKGVFELIDEIGIDVGAAVMRGELLQFFQKRKKETRISMAILDLYNAGYRGQKNLNGFYSYHSKTGKRRIGKVDEDIYDFFGGKEKERMYFKTKQIRQRLMMAVVNEAALCLQEGTIFSPQDGDLGAIFGIGFPTYTGGPFRYMDGLGVAKALKRLRKLKSKYGVRFTPAFIIEELAQQERKFYSN